MWLKPLSLISIHSDSAITLAKAYSHLYNGKLMYIDLRYSYMKDLITNGAILIDFVRYSKNLSDHLTKRLSRDLIKTSKGMDLKVHTQSLLMVESQFNARYNF